MVLGSRDIGPTPALATAMIPNSSLHPYRQRNASHLLANDIKWWDVCECDHGTDDGRIVVPDCCIGGSELTR
jgi:hypothetical protein